MKKAIFPGSFDPFTIGHYSIVLRGLKLFDHITIGVGINQTKKQFFPIEKRLDLIRQAFKDEDQITVKEYNILTIDFAKQENAGFILRGIRNFNDFEYEKNIADINRKEGGIETVLLFTQPEYESISSTIVRDFLNYDKDVSSFMPPGIKL
ncbi:MAG: pantetheine-phosphate adenylyltransferase [Paludibacteraceae bacterium]|jgi:pantetheine-phosphate adenylyltransferase|nr:pantetheine-phosphate adenylyltransferase [Paludibacteraceae bacterium]MCR5297847.1 pantetheine-phosphate adenylyltransferase [Paludibacteraceae bacterium]